MPVPEWIVAIGGPGPALLLLGGLVGGCVLFGRGFVLWRRKRLIEDTPTARIRSMPLGRVEVFGRAEEKTALEAPLTGVRCVYYRYRVEEQVGTGRHRRWRTVAQGDSSAWPFYIEDETGRVLVDPRGAVPELRADLREWVVRPGDPLYADLEQRGFARSGWLGFGRPLRAREWHVTPGEPIYVLGVAQERAGLVQERRRRIAEKLAAWKRDPDAMARLDTNQDGRVDAEEWELARRLVVHEVELAPAEDRVVLAGAPDGSLPLVLADRPESRLVRSLTWRAAACVFGGVALTLTCLGILVDRLASIGRI